MDNIRMILLKTFFRSEYQELLHFQEKELSPHMRQIGGMKEWMETE